MHELCLLQERGPMGHQPDYTGANMPPGFYPLRLVLSPGQRAVKLVRAEMVLGRHSDVDIRLPTPDVSRRHCRFVFTEGMWEVHDLASLNGLYVNGQRVGQSVLRHHDLLAIGEFRLQVDLGAETEDAGARTDHEASRRVLQSIALALPCAQGHHGGA